MYGIGELQGYAIRLSQWSKDIGLDADRVPDGFLNISNLEITSDIPELAQIRSAKARWEGPYKEQSD